MRTWLILACLGAVAGAAAPMRGQQPAASAQTQSPPSPEKEKPGETDPGRKQGAPANEPQRPATTEQFPYPGEAQPASGTSAPPTGTPLPARPDGGNFPYPGDPDADAASSSSAGSSSSSSPDGGSADLPKETETPGRRKLPKQFHPQSNEDRGAEDLEVARFYEDKGNLPAAYLRAQDAVKVLPNDPETHRMLGEIAQKMQRREEAVRELQTYLRLEPDGEHAKQVRRLLAQLHP